MTNQAGVVDVNHVLNVCQRRCSDLGISVRFDQYAQTASTDGRTITIPKVKQPVTVQELDNLYGYVIHECGHHLRPEAFAILKAAQPPEHVAAMFNIAEDDGMERERALEWRGDRKALSNMNNNLITTASRLFSEAMAEGRVTGKQPPEPLAAMMLYQLSRLNWDDQSEHATASLLNVYPDAAKQLTKELIDEGWVGKFRATLSPSDTWDLAIDLCKRLYPNNNQDEYEQMREAGHGQAEGGNQRDTTGDTMPDSRNQSAVPPTEEGMGAQDEDSEGCVVSWKDACISEHTEWTQNVNPPGSIGIDWKGFTSKGRIALMPTNLVNVIDLATYDPKENTMTHYCSSRARRNPKNYMGTSVESAAFANKIRRYIQSKARSIVDKEKYDGKLDGTAIVRLALPPIDGGEYNKRIFYDQRKHTMKDTAIFILTDWSGSMGGKKMEYAADASQRLVYTFDRILNVPVALAAFTDRKSDCDIGYIKRFNTRGTTELAIAERFAAFYNFTSGNNDADALNWAWHELRKRRESRKILIVLSDGCPAGSWAGDPSGTLKLITRTIESDHRVELYGVGICSTAVEQYYTNHKVLHDPSEINETLFNIIKEGNNVKR